MKRLRLLLVMMVATLFVGHLFVGQGPSSVHARTLQPASLCSVNTLVGSYDFISSPTVPISQGTVIAIPDSLFALSPVPYAAKGTITFDGAGQLWIEAVGQGQEVAYLDNELTLYGAVYAVDGCTLMVEFENGSTLGVRIVAPDGVRVPVSTTPGFVILRTP